MDSSTGATGVTETCPSFQAAFPPGISEQSCTPQIPVLEPYFEVPTPAPFAASASEK